MLILSWLRLVIFALQSKLEFEAAVRELEAAGLTALAKAPGARGDRSLTAATPKVEASR
jgi:hypothetical protein